VSSYSSVSRPESFYTKVLPHRCQMAFQSPIK